MKQKHFIDFHKGITFIYILALINYYDASSNITIWIYLGLHGTYGILWVLKSLIFPDKWEHYKSIIPYKEQSNFVKAYYKRLTSKNQTKIKLRKIRAFSQKKKRFGNQKGAKGVPKGHFGSQRGTEGEPKGSLNH